MIYTTYLLLPCLFYHLSGIGSLKSILLIEQSVFLLKDLHQVRTGVKFDVRLLEDIRCLFFFLILNGNGSERVFSQHSIDILIFRLDLLLLHRL